MVTVAAASISQGHGPVIHLRLLRESRWSIRPAEGSRCEQKKNGFRPMADASIYAKFEDLGPFEIKDELIRLAQAEADKSARAFLNAGRGNPNWIATRAREAFFLLGQFALTEAKRVFEDDEVGLAGMPAAAGCYKRLKKWLKERGDGPAGRRDARRGRRLRTYQVFLRSRRLRPRTDQFHHRRPLSRSRSLPRPQRGDHP